MKEILCSDFLVRMPPQLALLFKDSHRPYFPTWEITAGLIVGDLGEGPGLRGRGGGVERLEDEQQRGDGLKEKWKGPSSVDMKVVMGDDLWTFPVMSPSPLPACLAPACPTRTVGTCLAFSLQARREGASATFLRSSMARMRRKWGQEAEKFHACEVGRPTTRLLIDTTSSTTVDGFCL